MSSFSPSNDLVPGDRIGRFRIVAQLGQGGMGVVYRALEENLGREVALKVIAPLFAHDPEFRERFTREARAQASLESAHVVAVYAHGEEDGYLYLASQLVPGGDLGHLIRHEGVPTMVDALEIIEQVGRGLSDAHDAGLVHRDIKPGNVLVRRRSGGIRAYLADFGIARKMNADATRFSSSTVGTPTYMAPELHGGAKAGAQTDIYALGCLLWVALTGAPPYTGMSEYQLVAAHIKEPVPQLAGNLPMGNATNRILRTAMAKDPKDRYQSAAEMSADLQAALRLPVTPGAAVPEDRGATVLRPIDRPTPTPGTPASLPPADRPTAMPTPTPTPSPTPSPGAHRTPTPTPQPTPTPTPSPSPATNHGQPPAYLGAYGNSPTPTPTPTPTPGFYGGTPKPRSTMKWWGLFGIAALLAVAFGIGVAKIAGDSGSKEDPKSAAEEFLEMEPKDIVRASEKEMAVVETAHITGQFKDSSNGDIVKVDVVSTTRGDCKGTMTSTQSGGVAEIIRVGDRSFLRADAKFWDATSGPGTADTVLPVIKDRWVEEESLVEGTEGFCDLDELLERDGRENADARVLGDDGEGEDHTVRVEQTQGSEWEVLTIRVAEPHHVIRIDESKDDYFEFSEFDKPAEITVPAADEIFDLQGYLDSVKKGTGGAGAKP